MPATPEFRIDGLTTSVAVKAPCVVATLANITLEGEQTVDGVALVEGDRVLVKDQTDAVENGIYVVSTGAWQRAGDFDGARDAVTGTLVIVVSATGEGVLYRVTTTDDPIVFGTSEITFTTSTTADAASVTFLQAGTGAVASNLQTKAREIISVLDFGAVGDDATNNATFIQNAINYVSSIGATLWFPPGVYRHTSALTFKNKARYIGSSDDWDGALGSVLKYTGSADGCKVLNPINSSTDANIHIEGLTFYATGLGAGSACFADTGSTFLTFRNCTFYTNYYGLTLDQSEVAAVEDCRFYLGANGIGGVWIVNGADHTVGANSLYTNRITIDKCQFYGTNASSNGIIDDGGIQHVIRDCNLDSVATPIRAHAVSGLLIEGCELENWSGTYGINFKATKLNGVAVGPTQEATIISCFFLTSLAARFCVRDDAANAIVSLTCIGNEWDCQNATAGGISSAGNPSQYTGMGNRQTGIGLTGASEGNTINRSSSYTPTITAAGGGFSLGNGTSNGIWQRNGNLITVSVEFGVGSTTNLGAGVLTFTLPTATTGTKPQCGAAYGLVAAVTFCAGTVLLLAAGSTVQIFSGGNTAAPVVNGWTVNVPAAWAAGDTLSFTITYQISNAILI